MKNKKIVVLYHNKCDDGFGAAWAAWKKFKNKAEYIGVTHGDSLPKGLRRSEVYILDFCYPKNVLTELMKTTKSLTIIDHHISMKGAVESVPRHLFDGTFSHSGAVLSWSYFHPRKSVPKLLLYVEGVDLWNFKRPHTSELSASLEVYDRDFEVWSKIARDWEGKEIQKYIDIGKALVVYQNHISKNVVENSIKVEFLGIKTCAANFSGKLVSQIGHELYEKLPPIGIVWSMKKDHIKVALRSNGKVDVSKLAAKFGGGGHKTSAAFELKLNQKLPWKIIKK